ncbi:hypothetical protein NKG05_15390 [Oerskovia sp. M15]
MLPSISRLFSSASHRSSRPRAGSGADPTVVPRRPDRGRDPDRVVRRAPPSPPCSRSSLPGGPRRRRSGGPRAR